MLDIRGGLIPKVADITGKPFQKTGQLAANQWHDQQQDKNQKQEKQRGNNGGGNGAADAAGLKPVGQRVEKIRNRHARHEGQQNARKQPDQKKERATGQKPETHLIADRHVGFPFPMCRSMANTTPSPEQRRITRNVIKINP